MNETLQSLQFSSNTLFLMLGAVMIFAMHAGFAFLEVGTVRQKNQVNALVKIITDWSASTVVYFLIGFPIAYGINFWMDAGSLSNLFNGKIVVGARGFDLVHCFFLTTFAACIPAIISGRSRSGGVMLSCIRIHNLGTVYFFSRLACRNDWRQIP